MAFNRDIHHRRSIRLRGYDYSQPGAYFVTACTWQREHLFGEVIDGEMVLNEPGEIVAAEWLQTAVKRPSITLGEFVVMPNHFHGIVIIGTNTVGATCWSPKSKNHATTSNPVPTPNPATTPNPAPISNGATSRSPLHGPSPSSVGALIAGFKCAVTTRINTLHNTRGRPIWQRNYWERIIRSEDEYRALCAYIRENPAQWALDSLYSDR